MRLWNLPDGSAFRSLIGWAKGVKCLSYTPDGQQLLAGGRGGRIARWSLSEERPLDPIVGHRRKVAAFAVAQDGRTLFSSGAAADEQVWMNLILGLVHWRGRHDVELDDAEPDPATRWGEVELGD